MVKKEREFQDSMFISQYIWNELYKRNNMSYLELSKKIQEKTWRKISWVFLWQILWGKAKWNYENLEAVALTIWLSKEEFQEIFEEAKRAEFKHTTWKDIADDISIEEAIKINFRKQWIIDNEEAMKDAKAVIEFLINKYHK